MGIYRATLNSDMTPTADQIHIYDAQTLCRTTYLGPTNTR